MPTPTYAMLLVDAKIALQRLLQGYAEVTVNNRRYRRPDELREYIKWLEGKAAAEARGGRLHVRRAVPLG
jgi:hypothetical protein